MKSSVLYWLVGAEVSVRLTATMLEVLHQGTRVACAAYYQTCTTFDAAPGVIPLLVGEPAC
jgi:hypothetical protein